MSMYEVKITECSKELTAKERIAIKDTTNAIKLDEATKGGNHVTINVDYYAILSVHNEKSEDVDYDNYIIVDTTGEKYVTGSNSFFNSFKNIYDEMAGEDEDWALDVYTMPSKNYSGKEFITCSIS